MSAKDAFFKKVQENSQAQQSNEERVKKDIKQFQTRTLQLIEQIKSWLQGSGIEIIEGTSELYDSSVSYLLGNSPLMRYQVANLVMKNGSKTAKLTPKFLYGVGSNGHLTLTTETPLRAPSKQEFSLHMFESNQSEEGWHLKRSGKSVILTEDIFFDIISCIA